MTTMVRTGRCLSPKPSKKSFPATSWIVFTTLAHDPRLLCSACQCLIAFQHATV
jgi:hypothetical protein